MSDPIILDSSENDCYKDNIEKRLRLKKKAIKNKYYWNSTTNKIRYFIRCLKKKKVILQRIISKKIVDQELIVSNVSLNK